MLWRWRSEREDRIKFEPPTTREIEEEILRRNEIERNMAREIEEEILRRKALKDVEA